MDPFIEIAEQVPALAVLAYLSWQFLKHQSERDKQYLEDRKAVNLELRTIAENMHELCNKIENSQKDVCHFHDDFANSLRRIEVSIGTVDRKEQ